MFPFFLTTFIIIQALTSSASGDTFPYQAEFGRQHDNLLITYPFNFYTCRPGALY